MEQFGIELKVLKDSECQSSFVANDPIGCLASVMFSLK